MIRSRPVAARAKRIALMVASVPEPTKRILIDARQRMAELRGHFALSRSWCAKAETLFSGTLYCSYDLRDAHIVQERTPAGARSRRRIGCQQTLTHAPFPLPRRVVGHPSV
jgi:hypothetical protein